VKRGVDVAGANLDDTDRRVGKFHPQSRRKRAEGGFRRAVWGHEGNGELRGERRDVDDCAATALAHGGKRPADQLQGRVHQQLKLFAHHFCGHGFDGPERAGTSVVDQHVECARFLQGDGETLTD